MAVYNIYPNKSSSVYSFYPKMNTGLDPIIDVSNYNIHFNSVPQVTRGLISFSQEHINKLITDNNISFNTNNVKCYLKLYIADAQGISVDSKLEVYPILGEWNNGTGTYLDSPLTTNGVSWEFKNFNSGLPWDVEGGDFHLTPKSEHTFKLDSEKDLYIDVTDIVIEWVNGNKDNNGFLIKWEDLIEGNDNPNIQPILQYFSNNTNTIYPPSLEIKWDDSEFPEGEDLNNIENRIITDSNIFLQIKNPPNIYNEDSVIKVKINVEKRYRVKSFKSYYRDNESLFLPRESYYAIQDLETNEFIVNRDNEFTKISCDGEDSYFLLRLNSFQPERYYQILIYYKIGNQFISYKDDLTFKLSN